MKKEIKEMITNETGKTSASGFFGSLTIFVGLISFVSGIIFVAINIDKSSEVLIQSLALIGIGTTLLGLRKHNNKYEKDK